MFEPTTTMTAVKTKTVTRTQMAVALACLGASIIAAAAMSIAGNNASTICTSNAKIKVTLTLGQGTLINSCKGQLIVPTPKFSQLLVRNYNDEVLTLLIDKKYVTFKVGEDYKPVGKPIGDIVGYQQNLYVAYSGKVDKKADINLFYGYPGGEKGVFCNDTDESQKNFDESSIKDFKFVNPYVKGTVSYYDEGLDEMLSVEDTCGTYDYGYSGLPVTSATDSLYEVFCSTANGGKYLGSTMACEGGCVDGACVPMVASSTPPVAEPVTPSSTPPNTPTSTQQVGAMNVLWGGKLATNKLQAGENEVAKLSFNAFNEDVVVNQLIFTFNFVGSAKSEQIQDVVLKDSAGKVVGGPKVPQQYGTKYQVVLQNPPKGLFTLSSATDKLQNFSLFATVNDPALLYGQTNGFFVSIDPTKDVAAVGSKTLSTITPVNPKLTFETMYGTAGQGAETVTSTTAILEVTSSTVYTKEKIFLPGSLVDLLSLTISNSSPEPIDIKSLTFTKFIYQTPYYNYLDLTNITLLDENGNTISESWDPNWIYGYNVKANIKSGGLVVDANGKRVVVLQGKVNSLITQPSNISGHTISYKFTKADEGGVIGKSLTSGLYAKVIPKFDPAILDSPKYQGTIFKAYPVLTKQNVGTNKLVNGTRDLFQFQVQAIGNDMSLYRFGFYIDSTVAKVSNLYLYDTTTNNEVQLNTTPGSVFSEYSQQGLYHTWSTKGSDWKTNFASGEMVVQKNQARTFVLRGNVSGATTGASVTTKLLGYCEFYGNPEYKNSSAMGTAEEATCTYNGGGLVWSDRSSDVHSLTSKDWTGGGSIVVPYNGTQFETVAY